MHAVFCMKLPGSDPKVKGALRGWSDSVMKIRSMLCNFMDCALGICLLESDLTFSFTVISEGENLVQVT